jgi:hypothetical protein
VNRLAIYPSFSVVKLYNESLDESFGLSTLHILIMTQTQIPSQFTGYVAADQQDPENFNLVKQSWTPKAFEEDDLIIKVECCGICGVSCLHSGRYGLVTDYP